MDKEQWEAPQARFQIDVLLEEDVLRLENILAKFIQSSDACFWNIEDALRCTQISMNNLEHQIREICDILSKEQEEYEQSLEVPPENVVVMNNINKVGQKENVAAKMENKKNFILRIRIT